MNDTAPKVSVLHRIEFERQYDRPVDRVWAAIAFADEISCWMKFPTRLDARSGGAIRVDFGSDGSLEGVVCAAQAPQLLTYTWGDSLVKWELAAEAGGTKLTLSHIGLVPDVVVGLSAGWHAFLDQLETHLTGIPRADRGKELERRYERELAAEV